MAFRRPQITVADPYHVGSSTVGKQWRDVDVRLILADEDYDRLIGGKPEDLEANPRWAAFCMAFSELGRRLTGLPIDFQIQQRSYANRVFPNQVHRALILASRVFSIEAATDSA